MNETINYIVNLYYSWLYILSIIIILGGHSSTVVTHSPLTSEVGDSNPEPYVGKMVISY